MPQNKSSLTKIARTCAPRKIRFFIDVLQHFPSKKRKTCPLKDQFQQITQIKTPDVAKTGWAMNKEANTKSRRTTKFFQTNITTQGPGRNTSEGPCEHKNKQTNDLDKGASIASALEALPWWSLPPGAGEIAHSSPLRRDHLLGLLSSEGISTPTTPTYPTIRVDTC